ncbi:MAG TPA: IS4 family transposase [Steroidobacteraceae bacterium]|nr:IS4 family transposase [Steroidobacteraceae bacterium]
MSRRKLALTVEEVPSANYLSIVWKYLTESMCQEVFAATRKRERQRKWALYTMVWFWIALLQSRYGSQTRALLEARAGSPLFPPVDATPEAFFQKVQSVRPVFFQSIFRRFTTQLKVEAPLSFERELPVNPKVFPEVYALDGSRLAKVARMLKVARKTTRAIIPGSMEAVYDLRRGLLHELYFDPDGYVGEIHMFEKVRHSIPRGSSIIDDRYYAKPKIWQEVAEQGLYMVSRYNRTMKKRRVAVIAEHRSSALSFDDWLVDMGGSQAGTTPVQLRWVRVWGPGFDVTLITNVLDPRLLTPKQLLAIYRRRWSIERMDLAMKEVLELNHLYNCSAPAVGQQVYATAGIAPEALSVDKLFPTLIDHYIKATCIAFGVEWRVEQMRARCPRFRPPDYKMKPPWLRIHVRDYLLEKRSEHRRRRRFCKGRSHAISYNKIPGAKKFLEN